MTAKKETPGKKVVHVSGKRKRSVARATLKQGKGRVKINNISIDVYEPKIARMKIIEPLIIAGDLAKDVDINVDIRGGGVISGAEAAKLAIGRALVEWAGKSSLKEDLLNYDRTMLVADVRYKEQRKPNDSKARAKRQKSYR
ncbi:MAG TPA: 30S ribosomal protein S9 [Candidatus Nanoarchaeia archaeon]|nr:30S ribosomal protein S9 [Candidatus Nanoarchaeia archaeon]